jgi:hypothetical protein
VKPEDLHVGQEVYVFDMNTRYTNGKPPVGKVMKVGRKLVQIQTKYSQSWTPYRIEDQNLNTQYSGHFRTFEQQAEIEQDQVDRETLAKYGFKLDYTSHPSREDLRAVAEFLRRIP